MADRYQNRAYPLDDGHSRQPAQQQPSAESDPLAELARLIGQSDPFNNFGRDARPAPSRDTSFSQHTDDHEPADLPPPGPPSWMQRMRQTAAPHQPAYETVADDQGHHSPTSFAPAAEAQPDLSRYDNVLYEQHDQGYGQEPRFAQPNDSNFGSDQYAYQDDAYASQDEAEPEQKPRRGGLLTVAVVIALGVVGTAGAYAYRSFVSAPRSGEPPVIKADTGPTKIVPPANQPTDGSKLIYDRIGQGGSAPERVVSREEQPLDVNKNAGARVVFPPLNQGGASAQAAAGARTAAPPSAPAAAQNEEPRKVRTLSIRPDQAEPAPAPAPAKQPSRAAVSPPPAPPANANASANAPLSLSPQGAPQRTASTTTAAPPAAASGNYVVQVSSQRSEADAQASYRALQGKYPSVLGSRSASIRRADLGDKGVYYRAMVGPFGSSEDATRLCDSLKAAGGQCNIMRN